MLAGWLLAVSCSPAPRTATSGRDPNTPPCADGNSACSPAASAAPADRAQSTGAASDGALNFALINLTGQLIHAVYVSPHGSTGWEENVLGRDQLFNGETLEISFNPAEQSVNWDLRIQDANGRYAEWKNLNLREISIIKLRLDGHNMIVSAEAE